MDGAQGDGSTPQAGEMHGAPTPISPSHSPSLKCIDRKGSSYSHQLKAGCSVAPPQVDREGQPYSTRCDAPHRTRSVVGGADRVGLSLSLHLGGPARANPPLTLLRIGDPVRSPCRL